MSIANRIKEIILEFIKNNYFDYLDNNNLLLLEENKIEKIITEFYNNNSTILKQKIRNTLKNEMQNNYPSMSIENTLYDIFQDNSININRILLQIKNYQNSISKNITLKVFQKNLGIKINIKNHIEIISAENPNKNNKEQEEVYNIINQYKYIYSINDKILSNINKESQINLIKDLINNEDTLKLIIIKNN